jgi:hypothetical protein
MMTANEKRKIEQWDYVDNAIFDLINELNPSTKTIEWDIKPISEIREILVSLYVQELKLCTEDDFYP